MRAIEITAPGKPDVLRETERPTPAFGAGEVLIRVAASGINRPDVLQRKGLYPVPPGASDMPGLEVAGTIVDGDRDALAAAGFASASASARSSPAAATPSSASRRSASACRARQA